MTRNLTGLGVVEDFVRNPRTEMVCAFVIAMSKDYIFSFIYQFTGDQLAYTILRLSVLFLPWVLLGHGALRYIDIQNKTNTLYVQNNGEFPNPKLPKKNLHLLSFLFIALIAIEFISF